MHVSARFPGRSLSLPVGVRPGKPRVTAPDDSDEALLGRVAAHRDPDALTALYDRHRGIAYGMALRVTGSVPIAEDVLQDAFFGAWRQASAFDPSRGSGRSWLLSIVHHRAVDAVRRRRPTDPLPESEGATASPAALVAPDVWPEVAGRLDAEAVRRALDTLPRPQREAIELAYWGGLTQTEIAVRTSQPLGTVKGRMRLGLQALSQALRIDGGTGGPGDDEVAVVASRPRTAVADAPTDGGRDRAAHRGLHTHGGCAGLLAWARAMVRTARRIDAASRGWSVGAVPLPSRARGRA